MKWKLNRGLRLINLLLLTMTLGVIGCSSKNDSGTNLGGRISPTYNGPPEISYCSSTQGHSPSHTITGTAMYQPRAIDTNGLGAPGTARPIRYAEVRVIDSSNSIVQCAETDNNGAFSFQVPQSGLAYTIQVNARADNSQVKVSVLDAPETNNIYRLSTSVTADASKSVGTITALADDAEVLAGAFNIYDMILMSNEYLRAKAGSCSTIQNCTDFTVANKVSAYWELGFNPGSYFGSGGLSFYLPGYDRLFILGGVSGDYNTMDTDHFDNSVIIHEYGHFLEDNYSDTDSPGGSHSGNKVIDPRLALGEGWGNFFQAAVRSEYATELGISAVSARSYLDSVGNISGSTGYYFVIDLEDPDASCTSDPTAPGCDIPEIAGEGNFREFSVARFFWDVIDSADDGTDTISDEFVQIWAALTSSASYINSSAAFKDIGFLHSVQDSLNDGGGAPITDWDPLRAWTQHHHQGDQTNYAQFVDDDNSCAAMSYNLTPIDDDCTGDSDDNICNYTANSAWTDSSQFASSHLLRNNDFYHYYHPGGALSLTLNYETQSGIEADLDLYLYNTSANFGVTNEMLGYSREENTAGAGVETETFSLSSLAAGHYLINIYVYTLDSDGGVGGPTDYELIGNGGARICPASLP